MPHACHSEWHGGPIFGLRRARTSDLATRALAAAFLAQVPADRARGVWVDPRAGSVPFGEYAASWLTGRVDLRPRTVELYDGLLRRHLLPHLARVPLDRDHPPAKYARSHAARIASGLSSSTVAKANRLLKTMLNTAVADERLLATRAQFAALAPSELPNGDRRRWPRLRLWQP